MKILTVGPTKDKGAVSTKVSHVNFAKPQRPRFGIDGFGLQDPGQAQATDPGAPKVRLVIPTYNYARFLPACLDSLLAQTFTDWTCCIVDDASTDETATVVQQYLRDQRIRYVRMPEQSGTGASLNLGYSLLPPSEYETWFAADNIMYPEMLNRLQGELNAHPQVIKVYSDYDIAYVNDQGKVVETRLGSVVNRGMEYEATRLSQVYFLGIGWLWRRWARETAGDWSEKPCEDYDMARRMARIGLFRFVPVTLAWYRAHPDNLTNQMRRQKETKQPEPRTTPRLDGAIKLPKITLPQEGPLVRLVIPTRNYAQFLPECLRSLQAQTMSRWTCCVVDDASTDDTKKVVAPFLKDKRFTYMRNKERLGTGGALNAGFACLPPAPYETWWASDNTMEPQMLERLLDALHGKPHLVCSYGNFLFRYETQGAQKLGTDEMDMRYAPGKLLAFCYVGICWLWRTDVREKAGEFSQELCEDYDMHTRLAEHGHFVFVPECLGTYLSHGQNISTQIEANDQGIAHERRIIAEANQRLRCRHNPLRVLNINMEFDCAGVGWRLRNAFAEYSNMHVDHAHGMAAPWCPKTDCLIADRERFMSLVKAADVLHFNEWSWRYRIGSNFFESMHPSDRPTFDFAPYLKDKRVIFHMHGGPLQLFPDEYLQMCREAGATLVACDPLTESVIPGSVWMPNLLNAQDIEQADGDRPFHGPLKVHVTYASPAVESAKGVPKIREAMQFLSYRGMQLDFREIHSVDWRECLRQRRQDHLCIENLTQGFIGMAGWESLWMGHVVIARLDPVVASRYQDLSYGAPVPIQNVSGIDHMARRIRELYALRGHVEEIGRWGKAWINRYYNRERIVRLWENLYEGKRIGVQRMEDETTAC